MPRSSWFRAVLALGLAVVVSVVLPAEASATSTTASGVARQVFGGSLSNVSSLLAEFAKPILAIGVALGFLVFAWSKGDEGKTTIMRWCVGCLGCIFAVTLGNYFLSGGSVV
ncbi:MAG TPA: hypothetical protein VFS20_06190 [Longimicrobium sp.]|nr:hypothetical protein [Longimicrobium sp.]